MSTETRSRQNNLLRMLDTFQLLRSLNLTHNAPHWVSLSFFFCASTHAKQKTNKWIERIKAKSFTSVGNTIASVDGFLLLCWIWHFAKTSTGCQWFAQSWRLRRGTNWWPDFTWLRKESQQIVVVEYPSNKMILKRSDAVNVCRMQISQPVILREKNKKCEWRFNSRYLYDKIVVSLVQTK